MNLLQMLLNEIAENRISPTVWNFLKILIQDRTYMVDELLTSGEANRIKFRKSGIPETYSTAQKKMIIIGFFINKVFLPQVFCSPENFTKYPLSSLARL